jgi:hypothetical protein
VDNCLISQKRKDRSFLVGEVGEGGYIEYPPLMTLPDPILAAEVPQFIAVLRQASVKAKNEDKGVSK